MTWNWQHAEWPNFSYDKKALESLESDFLLRSGEFLGVFRHVGSDDRDQIRLDLISEEALKTSAIEGEYLDRESLQSSLRQQLGLGGEARRVPPAERGIAEMMADVYLKFASPLSHRTLYAWHKMVMSGERRIETIGSYRNHADAMQIVSNRLDRPEVHFEAPPSARVKTEMDAFVVWFNNTSLTGKSPLPALTRAGMAHLYFESIHPFEDGNGRIGRALSEKALAKISASRALLPSPTRSSDIARLTTTGLRPVTKAWKSPGGLSISLILSSKLSALRSRASNLPSPKPDSTSAIGASSTKGRRKRLPAYSAKALMASKAA